ncbi:hypothetical protein BH23ACT5_BH23ACT5_23470 [soil metagenome]
MAEFLDVEVAVLADLIGVLSELGDATSDPGAARLDPPVYLGDPDADAEWRRLAGAELVASRRADRSSFETVVDLVEEGGVEMSRAEAEAFLRVVNDVRLVLGARWNIDGPDDFDKLRAEAADIMAYLGWLVTDLTEVLSERLGPR